MIIKSIDKLLKADDDNINVVKKVLHDYHPKLIDFIDDIVSTYDTAVRDFAQGIKDHFTDLDRISNELDVDDDLELEQKIYALIRQKENIELAVEAQQILYKYFSRECRGILLLDLRNLFSMEIADILRMRVTSSLFYLRLQCETLAFIKLMLDNPEISNEWRKCITEEDGIRFFRNTQSKIKSILKSFDLEFSYNFTSGAAVHTRFGRSVRGMEVETSRKTDKIIYNMKMAVQEFDGAAPEYFILNIIFLLQAQSRILFNLSVVCPEITDPILLKKRIPKILNKADNFHSLFPKKFPQLAKRIREIDMEMNKEKGAGDSP